MCRFTLTKLCDTSLSCIAIKCDESLACRVVGTFREFREENEGERLSFDNL